MCRGKLRMHSNITQAAANRDIKLSGVRATKRRRDKNYIARFTVFELRQDTTALEKDSALPFRSDPGGKAEGHR